MVKAYRASLLSFRSDPERDGNRSYDFYEDGLLIVDKGRINAIGPYQDLIDQISDEQIIDYSGHLIIPGLIDAHTHYPQLEVIASHGKQLLDWLEQYTFPAEKKFEDPEYAATIAEAFLDELLRNGTTTAAVFGTIHKASVDCFFEAAQVRNMRMICGKVMMDQNAPDYLRDTIETGYQESRELIEKWHKHDRLLYAVTPRFAVTSSPEQLQTVGKLCKEYPDIYLQTHLAENRDEIARVKKLFPGQKNYLDVYKHYGLLGKRSLLAHGIYLSETEHQDMKKTDSKLVFCPTSNLFLGSGLLNIKALNNHGVCYGIGSDVGAGTSFSMLRTLSEAYKVGQSNDHAFSPLKLLYLATLGNAKLLDLDDRIGSLNPGNEADFVVLDLACTPLMKNRQSKATELAERIFSLIILGDDRAILASYVAGKCGHERNL